jgi:hypothetical protein
MVFPIEQARRALQGKTEWNLGDESLRQEGKKDEVGKPF